MEPFLDRMHFIFSEFDNILCLFFRRKRQRIAAEYVTGFPQNIILTDGYRRVSSGFRSAVHCYDSVRGKYVCPVGGGSPDRSVLGLSADGDAHLFSVIIRCTGILGMIRNRKLGYGTCRNTPMWINLQNNPVTTTSPLTGCRRRIGPRQVQRWYRIFTATKDWSACWGTGQTSLFRVTAAFSTRNTVIVEMLVPAVWGHLRGVPSLRLVDQRHLACECSFRI